MSLLLKRSLVKALRDFQRNSVQSHRNLLGRNRFQVQRYLSGGFSGGSTVRPETSMPPMPSNVDSSDVEELSGRSIENKRLSYHTGEESIYKLGKHRSNALHLVHQIPVTEVEGELAVCDGGGGALGHPLEYISLQRGPGVVVYCPYCSLRYTKKAKK